MPSKKKLKKKIEKLQLVAFEGSVVVFELATALGLENDEKVDKTLDNLCSGKRHHKDIIPFHLP